ncbi:DIG-like 4 [Hibiscus trionum]|uniref:DIG-like 4 n=1 Tax=Hibiscus trionum TaxID=183268 RepID=A0A9W7JBT1_HIBTR|nr:DIG-like 4 [Hibiscus trionum]
MNNSGEKWSFVRYTWGSQDKTVNINQIMLRFRPIAPKPVTGESDSCGGQFGNKNLLLCKPRAKRKYVRVRKNHIKRKNRPPPPPPPPPAPPSDLDQRASNKTEKIVTLQLLPEKNKANGSINDENSAVSEGNNQDLPSLFNLNLNSRWINRVGPSEEPDRTAVVSQTERKTVVESWVTVECVTDTCMVGRELGCTDVEKMKNLEADTCPGFISGGLNKVQWVNGAYERMLTAGEGRKEWLSPVSPPEIKVWLVMKEDLPKFCSAFSCKVRLQFTWQNKCSTIMMPCDVWKMDGGGSGHGGFAWRLDVEAALSLGR